MREEYISSELIDVQHMTNILGDYVASQGMVVTSSSISVYEIKVNRSAEAEELFKMLIAFMRQTREIRSSASNRSDLPQDVFNLYRFIDGIEGSSLRQWFRKMVQFIYTGSNTHRGKAAEDSLSKLIQAISE